MNHAACLDGSSTCVAAHHLQELPLGEDLDPLAAFMQFQDPACLAGQPARTQVGRDKPHPVRQPFRVVARADKDVCPGGDERVGQPATETLRAAGDEDCTPAELIAVAKAEAWRLGHPYMVTAESDAASDASPSGAR